MPYKDSEMRRLYALASYIYERDDPEAHERRLARGRAWRKGNGMVYTRTYDRAHKRAMRQKSVQMLGGGCAIGQLVGELCRGPFDRHNKMGDEHPDGEYYYAAHTDDFVLLCRRHHKIVHDFCLKCLGLSWVEIIERLRARLQVVNVGRR